MHGPDGVSDAMNTFEDGLADSHLIKVGLPKAVFLIAYLQFF